VQTQPDSQIESYRKATNESKYSRDEGLLVLPVMGPAGTPPTVLRMHGGVGFRKVRWEAEKLGAPPLIPAFTSTSNDTIMFSDLYLSTPKVSGSQVQYLYEAHGEYTFVQNVTRGVDSNFQTGNMPYQTQRMNNFIFNASNGISVLSNFGGPMTWSAPISVITGFPDPTGPVSAEGASINISNPNYMYLDSTISGIQFFSEELIS